MKNKRTKFTALLLSALMAVSTISSVTWAADLFSDGSDGAEVVAEETETFASNEEDVTVTEEVVPAEEELLNTKDLDEAGTEVANSYYKPVGDLISDPKGDYYEYKPYEDLTMTDKGQGVFLDTDNTYKFKYLDGKGIFQIVPAKETGYKEKATCKNPPRVQVSVSFTYTKADGSTIQCSGELWYYDVRNFEEVTVGANTEYRYYLEKHHSGVDKYLLREDDSKTPDVDEGLYDKPNCESKKEYALYRECEYCKYLFNFTTEEWAEVPSPYNSAEEYLLTSNNYKSSPYAKHDWFGIEGHISGSSVMTTLPPVVVNGEPFGEYDPKVAIPVGNTSIPASYGYAGNTTGDPLPSTTVVDYDDERYYTFKNVNEGLYRTELKEYYNKKANCKVINGTHSGAMDPNMDAYVYNVTFCSVCGKVVSVDKDIFNHTDNMTEATEYYMGVKNIAFFINKKGEFVSGKIAKDDFKDVVLDNCDLDGVYDLYVTSKDWQGNDSGAPTVAETIPVKAGHKWMIPEVQAQGIPKGKEKDYFKMNGTKIYVEGNPETGYKVYAKDCKTEAYYALRQHCMNPKCRYNDPDYGTYKIDGKIVQQKTGEGFGISNPALDGGQRKALPGDHQWLTENEVRLDGRPGRFVDPTKTVYEQIKDPDTGEVDMKHHLERYKDSVECRLCGTQATVDSNKAPAVVDHIFVSKEVAGSRIEPDCGNTGSAVRIDTCVCKLTDESTRETVTIPATDKHDFGKNPPIILWSGGKDTDNDGIGDGDGAVYIADGFVPGVSLHADIVRQCTKCLKYDSNGINTMIPGGKEGADVEISGKFLDRNDDADHWDETTRVPAGKWCANLHVTSIVPANTDPSTGIAYRCSTAHATIEVDWVGTVDGKVKELNKDTAENAVKENVPYYKSVVEYQARTSHTPGKPQKEGDRIITRCTVCGEIVSNDPDNTPSVGVPTVSAASVDFDTVNVSWTKVEGATAYRLYFRSSDEGINKWQRIRTFTGDATSYPVNGLTTGSKYRFTVRAEITQDGKTTLGDYSRKGAVAVPKLTAPEIKSVTASGKTTKVTWSRVDGASGYIVFRNSQRVGTVTKGSKLSWTDKKPVSGAKYQVRAYRTEDKKNYKSNLSEPK